MDPGKLVTEYLRVNGSKVYSVPLGGMGMTELAWGAISIWIFGLILGSIIGGVLGWGYAPKIDKFLGISYNWYRHEED